MNLTFLHKKMYHLAFSTLLFLLVLTGCQSNLDSDNNNAKLKEESGTKEKFEYIRKEPANKLGIFTKVIAHIFRPANQTTEEYRINREYMPDDVHDSLVERCESNDQGSNFVWSGCSSDKEGLFSYVSWGIPEPKNKTVTYLEMSFEPFTKTLENGDEEICLLEEVYKSKAYVVLHTFSEVSQNSSSPEFPIHHHQLDSFGQNFLDLFGDNIDLKAIYNFGEDEYFERDPPYECFLAISSSETVSVIEDKCDFFCLPKKDHSKEEIEKILHEAKKRADEEEDVEGDLEEEDHFQTKNRVEL